MFTPVLRADDLALLLKSCGINSFPYSELAPYVPKNPSAGKGIYCMTTSFIVAEGTSSS